MDELYIHNNGKGWAIFKKNPNHHRDFAWVAETKEWTLGFATYYRFYREAETALSDIQGTSPLLFD